MKSELSERKKKILKAIVEAHISYGEPVGFADTHEHRNKQSVGKQRPCGLRKEFYFKIP